MRDLDFLVPFALVEPALASELLRSRPMPHLERFLARAGGVETTSLPFDAALTTWQSWVFGRRAGVAVEHVNVAELGAMACGVGPASRAGRYLAEPAHFSIAKDHLLLDDPRGLTVTLDEAHALADSVEPVLAAAGWRLEPPQRATLRHWFVARDDGIALSAPSIDRAIGENVAAWQPRTVSQTNNPATLVGSDVALDWRRCVNEIQMLWFAHPVNDAREANGLPTINTLWLSGNGEPRSALPRYTAVDSGVPLFAALPVDNAASSALETFDRLMPCARGGDWGGWCDELERLDARLAEILRRQSAGELASVTLVLCGADTWKVATLGARDRAKFWRGWSRRPPLGELFAEGALA